MIKLKFVIILFFTVGFLQAQIKYVTVTDVAGRRVKMVQDPTRVILGEGRMLYTVALLDKEKPFKRIIAWRKDLQKYDPDTYNAYKKRFPEIAKITPLGNNYLEEWNLESIISLNPELILLNLETLERERENGLLKKLEKAGIAVIFIDNRLDPEHNSLITVRLLGQIFKQEQRAEQFTLYYQRQIDKVYEGLKNVSFGESRLIFLESAAGYSDDSCCFTFGKSSLGRLVELAGSRNWGSEKSDAYRIGLSFEALLASQPHMIVGTGSNWSQESPSTKGVLLGYEAKPEEVQKQLLGLTARNHWSELNAVQKKDFYSVFHQFVNAPYHFVAIQAFARWAYPEIFQNLDPVHTLKEMHEKFLPVAYSGVFLAKLQ